MEQTPPFPCSFFSFSFPFLLLLSARLPACSFFHFKEGEIDRR